MLRLRDGPFHNLCFWALALAFNFWSSCLPLISVSLAWRGNVLLSLGDGLVLGQTSQMVISSDGTLVRVPTFA